MGPISTGLGEIYMWTVEAQPGAAKPDGEPYTLVDLRTIQDWIVKPQVRTVPGVTEVNSIGGYEKQYHVTPDPAKLLAHGLSFRDVFEALARNNANAGGGYIEHFDEQYLIRATGLVQSPRDIENIVIGTEDEINAAMLTDPAQVSVSQSQVSDARVSGDIDAAIAALLALGPRALLQKRGEHGARLAEEDHARRVEALRRRVRRELERDRIDARRIALDRTGGGVDHDGVGQAEAESLEHRLEAALEAGVEQRDQAAAAAQPLLDRRDRLGAHRALWADHDQERRVVGDAVVGAGDEVAHHEAFGF